MTRVPLRESRVAGLEWALTLLLNIQLEELSKGHGLISKNIEYHDWEETTSEGVFSQDFWNSCHFGVPINIFLLSIPRELGMLYGIVLYVCLSVRPLVFTITQERLDVERWNLANIHLRSRVTWSSKIGHVHDLWPGQIEDFQDAFSESM